MRVDSLRIFTGPKPEDVERIPILRQRDDDDVASTIPNQYSDGEKIWQVPFQSPRWVRLSDNDHFAYNNFFRLRFYLPESPASQLFIMTNGFSEGVVEVWDRLGATFAKAGVGAVLLPLPQHYSRNVLFHINDYHETDHYIVNKTALKSYNAGLTYGFLRRPELLAEFDGQIMEDVKELMRAVTSRTGSSHAMNDFTRSHFSENVEVSVLGFSLGGLVALQAFLSQPDRYHSCVLINSGASFQDMNASQVFKEHWRSLQRAILAKTRGVTSLPADFAEVFLGHEKVMLLHRLEQHKNKLLIIIGGSDAIFNMSNIANILPRETGLAVFQIPGLGHFINIPKLGGDIWTEWSRFTANMILSFNTHRPGAE